MTEAFRPGFRLSRVDIAVLVLGAIAVVVVAQTDRLMATLIAFVVAHFFLFCNVLRMGRPLELTWAGVFVGLAMLQAMTGVLGWPLVFGIGGGVTALLAAIELFRPSYHGVGWGVVNPDLPRWWDARYSVRERSAPL